MSHITLPTRQKNILRAMLEKPEITPEEVACLSFRAIERAPGVGRQSLEIIRHWLRGYGFEFKGEPMAKTSKSAIKRQHKIEQAIDYLREHGYEVRRLS